MSIQEATLRKELAQRVDSLERRIADLERRADDAGKAQRALAEQIEKPKRNAA